MRSTGGTREVLCGLTWYARNGASARPAPPRRIGFALVPPTKPELCVLYQWLDTGAAHGNSVATSRSNYDTSARSA